MIVQTIISEKNFFSRSLVVGYGTFLRLYVYVYECCMLQKDVRRYISLSTFGFYKGGTLDVNLTNFKAEPFDENAVVSN